MSRSKAPPKAKKVVWRISESAPMGEWVDASLSPVVEAAKKDEPATHSSRWETSSAFDLLSGADVIENPPDVPDELFDQWFSEKPESPEDPAG
jgi:hypothetical protein